MRWKRGSSLWCVLRAEIGKGVDRDDSSEPETTSVVCRSVSVGIVAAEERQGE
jgi:hypothetical protein